VDSFIIGVQILLAGVLGVAGVAKLFDLKGSRQALTDFGVPQRLAPPMSVLLPLAEIATAVALLIHPWARWGGVAAVALFLGFSAGIANAMRQGKDVDCGCFGRLYTAVAGSRALVRNLVLAALGVALVIHGPGPAIDQWVADRTAAELVAIVATVAAVALAAFSFWTWSENRKHRPTDAAAPQAPPTGGLPEPGPLFKGRPEGLPLGTMAPEFSLVDTRGETRTLKSLLGRGNPVVLEFVDPGCGACNRLLPALGRWQSALADQVTVAVVTQAEADDPVWDEHGISQVLLDETGAVYESFKMISTPTAVVVGLDGRVGSAPAGGAHMPEVLVRQVIRGEVGNGSPAAISRGSAITARPELGIS
jgi:thiol-disulfide isomerase/thioredoxin/uncharacterized membrane protein YphA (DoxX/SURF4 family)